MSKSHDEFCLSVGKAIELAAKSLPKGYVISIQIENGSGSCELLDSGQYSELMDGEGLDDEIQHAIDLALDNEKALAVTANQS